MIKWWQVNKQFAKIERFHPPPVWLVLAKGMTQYLMQREYYWGHVT